MEKQNSNQCSESTGLEQSTHEVGEAGEYYIASQAALRGFVANLQRSNFPGVDITLRTKNNKMIDVQVKTSRRGGQWRLTEKDERGRDGLFYVFVSLDDSTLQIDYIVPSAFVAGTIYRTHYEWLQHTSKSGNLHKDSSIREIKAQQIPDDYKAPKSWQLLK